MVILNTAIRTFNIRILDPAKTIFVWWRNTLMMQYNSFMNKYMKSMSIPYMKIWKVKML